MCFMSCQPSIFRSFTCRCQQTEEQEQHRILAPQAGLGLRATPKLSVDVFERVGPAQHFSLRFRKTQKSEKMIAGFLEPIDDRWTAESVTACGR